jgi:uncharacterized protein with HEPN domain
VSPVGRGVANYLRDVIEAIDRIAAYTHAQDFEAFGESRITQDAVARNFEVIGEALRQLSQRHPTTRQRIPSCRSPQRRACAT